MQVGTLCQGRPIYSGQIGETPLGSLSFEVLGTPLHRGSTVCPCHVLPSVECSNARPCLGNKLISFSSLTLLRSVRLHSVAHLYNVSHPDTQF